MIISSYCIPFKHLILNDANFRLGNAGFNNDKFGYKNCIAKLFTNQFFRYP